MGLAMSNELEQLQVKEWKDSVDNVVEYESADKAAYLLKVAVKHLEDKTGIVLQQNLNTEYVNTIPTVRQAVYPGDKDIEKRISAYIRWNAAAIVLRANKVSSELGGHISSYAGSAYLYEVGFNHFWKAPSGNQHGDMIFFQGHASPGIYARSFVEGRFTEERVLNFRQESAKAGLSSYPHPWLMPDYWQFPTVSMGLGPLMAIYQARFADIQLKGPYSLWYHTHTFQPLHKGTLMTDRVIYRLPFSFAGFFLVGRFVADDIKKIFTHRYKTVREVFR
jgi:pyruvate dehydrogenase E1 component